MTGALFRVCYLGDDTLQGAAAYLAGIMSHFRLDYEHVPSAESPAGAFQSERYGLYVLSDYPAARFRDQQMEHVVECVERGSGLVMIGGWESFHGRLGEYHRSPLARALPVVMAEQDDRRNCPQPCLVNKLTDHPILQGLPWDMPPCIGGFNALAPKPEGATILTAVQFSVAGQAGEFRFARGAESPLLVVGRYGRGRTAALATDVAPHWVGGLVDWGDRRIVQHVAGAWIEVGNWYARFFYNLLTWAGQMR